MSADDKYCTSDDESVIPISEWPVSNTKDYDYEPMVSESSKRKRESEVDSDIFKSSRFDSDKKNKLKLGSEGWKLKQKVKSSHQLEKEQNNINISSKIAKWWRQRKAMGYPDMDVPKCSPSSMVYHISRLPECHEYLQCERRRLLQLIEQTCDKADICAALASLDDYTEQFSSALSYISLAVEESPSCVDYLWLKEKISRQCQIQEQQNEAKRHLEICRHFPLAVEVPKVSSKSLSVSDFEENYLKPGNPVIITDVVNEMTNIPFDFSLVEKLAGNTVVTTKRAVSESLTWAKLENNQEITITNLINRIKTGSTNEVLFDWSLPLHCPELARQIELPLYFKNNYLLQTSPGSLYIESWPSLFIAPEGAITELHVDAFHSHFWMALFEGEKRWTFFDQKDMACLYPRWFQSLDPVFEVNLKQPDTDRFPLLALTRPQQCVLQPGELLFVPAGSPHFVENLSPTLAISSNYVDKTNFQKVCEELKINALQDERAKDLLQQLQDPAFLSRVHSQNESS